VSLQTCRHRGVKLPDPVSCGARCSQFPRCLPPIPADVVAAVIDLHAATAAQERNSLAVAGSLELLSQALAEGLARREGQELDPPD
jgi:hypothetical protein